MNITTVKDKLLNAIQIAERITEKREGIPVLSCLLLEVDKDLLVRSTNLEAGVEIQVPGDSSGKGKIAVPAGVLSQTIRSITSEKIKLSEQEGNLVIESKGTRTLIKSIPHDEFPTLSSGKSTGGATLIRDRFFQTLKSVVYAASPSMIRPELGSIYVSIGSDKIICVATDSFRLAEKTLKGQKIKGGECEVLIPLKHALEVIHILERSSADTIAISVSESELTIVLDGVRYVSRVTDGTFPNYTEIVPKSFGTEATILKSDFTEMLKKARVFSGGEAQVGIHAYPKKKIFTATAQSSDIGEMSDSLDAAMTGSDIDINFHIGYLSDCLSVIEADSITLSFSGAGKPLVIRGVSDTSFMYLVMPLNR